MAVKKKQNAKMERKVKVGIITNTGRYVTKEVLEKYEIAPESKQIEGTAWTPEIIEPPHNLARLMSWTEVSVVHNSCVRVKQQDTVGLGYTINFNADDLKEGEEEPEKEKDANYSILKDFFNKVNDKQDLTTMLKEVFLEFEGCGNGYIEVSRGIKTDEGGIINGLFHVNATTVRWSKDRRRLIQKVGEKYVWFKVFGEPEILNRVTGRWDENTPFEKQANELIPITQYTWRSQLYGLPEWLPALYAMFGDMKEREYNIDFFLNFGIPAYAILVKGGNLSKEDKEALVKYFETELKGSNHKTLSMGLPKGTEIEFKQLNVDVKDASFRMYHKDNRDEILTAHHTPPYRVGIVEAGALGGNVAEATDRIYLDSVINPRQEQFMWVINELIIKKGFEIKGWQVEFQDINIADMKKNSEISNMYFEMGALSPNEIRVRDLGLDPYKGGDFLYIKSGLTPMGVTEEGIESGRVDELDMALISGISDEERKAGDEEADDQKKEAEEKNERIKEEQRKKDVKDAK